MTQLLISKEVMAMNLPGEYLQTIIANAESKPRTASIADVHFYRSEDFPTVGVVVKTGEIIVVTQPQGEAMIVATRNANRASS